MILVILGICLFIILFGAVVDSENVIGVGFVLGGIGIFILLILLLVYPFNVDRKIEMYIEENTNIETKIKDTVKAYMNYEQETYDKIIKDADLTTIVLKYPELNSNELVKSEIEIYKTNNDKIKQLKEQQIDRHIAAWWLYFGK